MDKEGALEEERCAARRLIRTVVRNALCIALHQLVWLRRTDMSKGQPVARSKFLIVQACLREAEFPVPFPPHDISIAVVLTIVFPTADRADFEPHAFIECRAAAAGASADRRIQLSLDGPH